MTTGPAIGERLGKYLIEAELGRGGMGVVYRARHVSLDRTVALKIVLSGLAPQAEGLNRFRLEARAIARLNHPNIVQVFDIEETDALTYLVMEYVTGENLDSLLKRTSPSVKRIARIAADVAGALHFAHTKGVLHRDIKPANVLLSEDRQVKVADFGLAYLLDTDKGYTKTGILVGSPHYMSPEQCQGLKLDGRSDLYSLGVVLFRMLTGRLPFQAASSLSVLMKQISDPTPDPKELAPELPEELAAITRRAMAKKPDDRFADMRGLRTALLAFLGEPPDDVKPSSDSDTTATTAPMLTSPIGRGTGIVTGGIALDVEPRPSVAQTRPAQVPGPTSAGIGTEIVTPLTAFGAGPRPSAAEPQPAPVPSRPSEPARPPEPAAPQPPPTPAPAARKAAPPRRAAPPTASAQPSRSRVLPWLLTVLVAVVAGVFGSRYLPTLTALQTFFPTAAPTATLAGSNPAPAATSPPSTSAATPPEPAPAPTARPEPPQAPQVVPPTAVSVEAPTEAPAPVPVPSAAPSAVPAVAPTLRAPAPSVPSPRRGIEESQDLPFEGDRKRPAGAGRFCFTESAQRHTFPTDAKKIDAASIQMHYEIDPAEPAVGDRVVVRALVANGSGADFLVDRFEESDPSGASAPVGLALAKNVPPGQSLELRRFTVDLKASSDIKRTLKIFDGEQGVWTRSFQVAPCR